MTSISQITRADWGAHIKTGAFRLAPFVAAIITAAILTYEAGAWLRITLHEVNDSLSSLWATAWGVGTDAHAERVDDMILGACMVAAVAWEFITKPDAPTMMAIAAPPLAPPPSRPAPAPARPNPLKQGFITHQ